MGIDIMNEQMKQLDQDMDEGKAWNDVSGMGLEVERVRDARIEEFMFFEKRKAYTRCRREQIVIEKGKGIDVMWIDVNKGDAEIQLQVQACRPRVQFSQRRQLVCCDSTS